jgi:hypothetical protein
LSPEPPADLACDVLVAGGGVAGVAAAVSASRRGSRVVLIEKNGQLGGTGTRGLLRSLCGLYLNGDTLPGDTLNPGIVREIVFALHARSPYRTVQKTGQVYVLPYEGAELASVFEGLCKSEGRLTVLLGSCVVAAATREGLVTEVTAEGNGRFRIRPRAAIDATGNGEMGLLAGAAFDLAPQEQLQLAGYSLRVKGLTNRDGLELKVPYVLAAIGDAASSPTLRFTTFSAGEGPDDGYLKFNSSDPEGPEREQRMQTDIATALALLATRLPSFRKAFIEETSRAVIDREGRRLRGDYVLTEEDVLGGRKFSDGAVRNAWPIEQWDRKQGTMYRYVPKGDYYEIPFRSLVVKGFANLLSAGRCISATHEALGSVRVMGCCMATGDSAGRAAAALVKTGKYGEYRLNE